MNKLIKNYIDFHKKAEKLKTTTRHSWLSDPKRRESVAEHSWMLVLMAMVLGDQIKTKVDLFKVIKMVAIHDLAEAVTGDIPSHEVSIRNLKHNKYKSEKKALKSILAKLPKKNVTEIIALWEEMEAHKTKESKFAQSLDKIEVVMQHNIANISTWDQKDYDSSPYYKDEYFDFDPFMRLLRNAISIEGMEKVIKAKTEHRLNPRDLERYKINNKK